MRFDKNKLAYWDWQECQIIRQSGEIIRFYVSRLDLDLTVGITFNSGYLRRRWLGGYLHDLIAMRLFKTIPDGYNVDHIDRNRLNNVRSNLRLSTYRGQCLNSPKWTKGYQQRGNRWRAYGEGPVGRQYLGNFDTEQEAKHVAEAFRRQMLLLAEQDGTYIYPDLQGG